MYQKLYIFKRREDLAKLHVKLVFDILCLYELFTDIFVSYPCGLQRLDQNLLRFLRELVIPHVGKS